MAGLVHLRLFRHHHFSIKQAAFIDDEFRSADIAFDNRFPFEDDFLRRDDRSPHLAADRDVLRRNVSIHFASSADSDAFARRNLTGDFSIDANVTLTSDFPFDDRPGTDQVEFFDRISFQSRLL